MLAMQETVSRIAPPGARVSARAGAVQHAQSLFQTGENVWRVAKADRAAVLIDAAAYFGALRQSMRQARRSIYIIGWDVDSRTPLMGPDGRVDDDLPRELGPFLSALAQRRPELQIKILLWDYSLFFTSEREAMPAFTLRWRMPPQIDLCLDDAIPLGSSHHQKIVIIDEQVAYSGGLDLTIRRWDNSDHDPDNPDRVDPAGKPYKPFHDIQMVVDGAAARALTDLARTRWQRAACEVLPDLPPATDTIDVWPEGLAPDFRDVPIGIARTEPPYSSHDEVREVERLFHDMIAAARHTIYVESQYVACGKFARALAAAMRRNPHLEAVIVCPRTYGGAFERAVMLSGRARVTRILRKAGVAQRVLMTSPRVMSGDRKIDKQVHAKFLIVDDLYLRVGSANLCNRSMGTDTECDLVVDGGRSEAARAAVIRLRNRLVAEHTGAQVAEIEASLERTNSLIATIRALPRRRHYLHAINHDTENAPPSPTLEAMADPERPIDPTQLLAGKAVGRSRRRAFLAAAGILLALCGFVALALAWSLTPLSQWADPAFWEDWLQSVSGLWAGAAVLGLFILAGLVVFPVTVMIAATAAIFGFWPGFLYAGGGALASAMVTYGIGRWLGPKGLRQFFGPRVNFLSRSFSRGGIPAVTLVRIVPVAPFSLINLAAGALRIPVTDYAIGTMIGLAPGVGLMSLLGHNLTELLQRPTLGGIATVAGVMIGAIALSIGAQVFITRRRGPKRRRASQTASASPAAR
jgi:phosphatidylserine/phosphatidylglycerophosphate/cardiolipin synthase-like enzyme/uncharacterized membrane protein YdjX (TVP38/TMEM64 family)